MSKNKVFLNVFLIFLLVVISAGIASPVMSDFTIFGKNIGRTLRDLKIKQGLDLQGGVHLVYQADMSQINPEDVAESLAGARDVIQRRVNAYGIAEPQILTDTTEGHNRIIVDLAGVTDVSAAIDMIGETPTLDFREEKTPEDYAMTPEEKQQAIESNKETHAQALAALQKTQAGEDFGELAKQNSADTFSAQNGGDLDFFKKGAMVPEFDEVAFKDEFKTGTVWPELVKTQFGYHILKKTDERGEGDNKEVRISHILFETLNEEQKQETGIPFKPTKLTGKDLDRAQVVLDPNTSEPQVSLQFNDEGKQIFKEITERNVGKRVAIFLDGSPITMPVVQTVISDGQAVITGSANIEEARDLSKKLNSGALPVAVTLLSQEKIGAGLGQLSLTRSLTAGVLGFFLTAVFMVIFYRLPGMVAVAALVFYAIILVAIFKLLGITLTLAGIAGFILSVGMAVDGNILIFERLKEELQEGLSLESALKNAFIRAWPSIRDGNMSTLITCAILASFGTELIRGFAITLGIGVALSMFTAVFVTRNILYMLFYSMGDKAILGLRQKSRLQSVNVKYHG